MTQTCAGPASIPGNPGAAACSSKLSSVTARRVVGHLSGNHLSEAFTATPAACTNGRQGGGEQREPANGSLELEFDRRMYPRHNAVITGVSQ
jgi:hypothetical protein